MSTPELGSNERVALNAILERSARDLDTHQMKCVPCRTPGVICGTGANIAATNADAQRALGLE